MPFVEWEQRMPPVEFLPAARRDYDESFDWYAARSPLAAVRFTNAVEFALSQIAADPERFAAVDDIHRGCALQHFPYRVIYRVHMDQIVIVAVAHAKRQPDYWKKRQ